MSGLSAQTELTGLTVVTGLSGLSRLSGLSGQTELLWMDRAVCTDRLLGFLGLSDKVI